MRARARQSSPTPLPTPSAVVCATHPNPGTAFDRFGFAPVLAGINTLLLGVPAILLVDSQRAQILTCLLYASGRVGLWASFFAFTGATFGFRHYGKLAGGGLMAQSIVCLLMYPLLAATLALERNFAFVNGLFLVLTAAQYVTILRLHRLRPRAPSAIGGSASVTGVTVQIAEASSSGAQPWAE